MGKLDGKVAVITAGTSGMALATAKLFVQEGASVYITGRREDVLNDAVREIQKAGPGIRGIKGDASNLEDLDLLFETVRREKGRIDILFASAGRSEYAPIDQVTEEHFDGIFDLNVRGTLFAVQKALKSFNDGGSIILNGSVVHVKGYPACGVYAASKAAVRSFVRTWVSELKDRNIRVNMISPGPIDTPSLDILSEEAKQSFVAQVPLGRLGDPEEIAATVLFLVSGEASYINGVDLYVDGGTVAF